MGTEKPNTWPRMNNIGGITRCAFTNFKMKEGKSKPGDNCLYKIWIAKLVMLIWHLSNQRICKIPTDDSWPTREEVRVKWITRMNTRLTIDHMSTQKKYGPSATRRDLVLKTWSGALKNEHTLPDDWINTPGVLVGMEFCERRGKESNWPMKLPAEPTC